MHSKAKTSEKSAQDAQKLADEIQADVRDVATALQKAAERAVSEAKAGGAVSPIDESPNSSTTSRAIYRNRTLWILTRLGGGSRCLFFQGDKQSYIHRKRA